MECTQCRQTSINRIHNLHAKINHRFKLRCRQPTNPTPRSRTPLQVGSKNPCAHMAMEQSVPVNPVRFIRSVGCTRWSREGRWMHVHWSLRSLASTHTHSGSTKNISAQNCYNHPPPLTKQHHAMHTNCLICRQVVCINTDNVIAPHTYGTPLSIQNYTNNDIARNRVNIV